MFKKSVALFVSMMILFGLSMNASAGRKKIHRSFTATAPVPYPQDAEGGCSLGVDRVSKYDEPFEAPAAGTLLVEVEGFQGDWDLFLRDEDYELIAGSNGNQTGGDPPEESVQVGLKSRQLIHMMPCNYLSPQPEVEVHYTFTFKK